MQRRTYPSVLLGAYRQLWSDISAEWRRDRNLVYYLVASAVFRDGLVGVFTFGAVLGVSVYGISQADVLIFGVAVSVVAAVGAVLGGHVDDRVGSKPVIVGFVDRDDRRRPGTAGTVRAGGVLGLRAGVVLLSRPDAGLGADVVVANVGRRAGRGGVRPLHDDGAGGVVPGAVAVLRCSSTPSTPTAPDWLASAWCSSRGCWPCSRCAPRSGATRVSCRPTSRSSGRCRSAVLHLSAVEADTAVDFAAHVDHGHAGRLGRRRGQG